MELKTRVQHPEVHERKDRGAFYWFFRYRVDEIGADGSITTTRKNKVLGPSRGKDAWTITKAREERDKFLAQVAQDTKEQFERIAAQQGPQLVELPPAPVLTLAMPPAKPDDPGDLLFGPLAEAWKRDYVEKVAAGKHLIGSQTRIKYKWALQYILPKWKDARLRDLKPKEVMDWLQEVSTSWHGMCGLRNAMSGIITKAIEWDVIPRSYQNPLHWVKLPKKWEVYEKRIHTPEDTARILALIEEPNLLICETCLDTGTRISEVTGLMIKHVDLDKGTIRIDQRNCRGDIDVPKTEKSKRVLTLGGLTERYKKWIAGLKRRGPNDWVFPQDEDLSQPRWDSGVRKALKEAAKSLKTDPNDKTDKGLDFPGFGPHSLRRANITWRQDVGGTSIEVSKIAGHSKLSTTLDYTIIGLKRQEELTRRLQDKRKKAAAHNTTVAKEPVTRLLAAQRARARNARAARKTQVETTKGAVA